MSQDPNTIDQVEAFVTGSVTLPLNASFGLEASLSVDWLPDDYTINVDDRIILDAADYALSSLLIGKVAVGTSDAKRLFNTYTNTNPDSLADGWLSVDDEYFECRNREAPFEASMGYTIDTSKNLKAMWPKDQDELDNMTIELYKDDVLVAPSEYAVDLEGLWWLSDSYDNLPVNVYVDDFELELRITQTAAPSDLDKNNLLDENIPIVDTVLEDLVTGTDDLELDSLNTGADKCKGVPRSISLNQYHISRVTLYPLDHNGDIVVLEPTTVYSEYFSLRESAGGKDRKSVV